MFVVGVSATLGLVRRAQSVFVRVLLVAALCNALALRYLYNSGVVMAT